MHCHLQGQTYSFVQPKESSTIDSSHKISKAVNEVNYSVVQTPIVASLKDPSEETARERQKELPQEMSKVLQQTLDVLTPGGGDSMVDAIEPQHNDHLGTEGVQYTEQFVKLEVLPFL